MALFSMTHTLTHPDPMTCHARPPLPSTKPIAAQQSAATAEHLREYAELAAVIGVAPPDLTLERFKAFLVEADIPTFSLPEVVKYMDGKSDAEGLCGWEWKPLRDRDQREGVTFGKAPTAEWRNHGTETVIAKASDYYRGLVRTQQQVSMDGNGNPHVWPERTTPSILCYARTVPLHALKKVAAVEARFTQGEVAFFVSDYATKPEIRYPDPFLMALIVNPELARGVGRFVIDFWDEPGFGLDKQLA